MKLKAIKNEGFPLIACLLLILLWAYTGLDKLVDWDNSTKAFYNQVFPTHLSKILGYVVPLSELLIAGLLCINKSRWWGFLASNLVLTVFTTYIGLIWVGAFPRVPCNCAGILETLSWATHFWLNCFFLLLGILGLYHIKKAGP